MVNASSPWRSIISSATVAMRSRVRRGRRPRRGAADDSTAADWCLAILGIQYGTTYGLRLNGADNETCCRVRTDDGWSPRHLGWRGAAAIGRRLAGDHGLLGQLRVLWPRTL